jgi:hypothetical protein
LSHQGAGYLVDVPENGSEALDVVDSKGGSKVEAEKGTLAGLMRKRKLKRWCNPNHYHFKFTNSTIHVIYHDVMVGNISMPAGCNCSSRSPGATFSSHCYSAMNTF